MARKGQSGDQKKGRAESARILDKASSWDSFWQMEYWDDGGAQSDQRILQRHQRTRRLLALLSNTKIHIGALHEERPPKSPSADQTKVCDRPPKSGRACGVAEHGWWWWSTEHSLLAGQWGAGRAGNFTRHASCICEVISCLSQRANRIRVKEREASRA
jgi:hypothetical protein